MTKHEKSDPFLHLVVRFFVYRYFSDAYFVTVTLAKGGESC